MQSCSPATQQLAALALLRPADQHGKGRIIGIERTRLQWRESTRFDQFRNFGWHMSAENIARHRELAPVALGYLIIGVIVRSALLDACAEPAPPGRQQVARRDPEIKTTVKRRPRGAIDAYEIACDNHFAVAVDNGGSPNTTIPRTTKGIRSARHCD